MSILFFEGFETSGSLLGLANQATSSVNVDKRWPSTYNGGSPVTDSFFLITDSFSEGFALQMGSNNFSNQNLLQWTVGSGQRSVGPTLGTEFIVGFRVHIPSGARTFAMFQVYASFGSGGSADFALNCVDSTDVSVSRFVGGTIETVADVLTPGSWHYLELRFIYSSSSASNGVYEVILDGTQIMLDETARLNGNFFTNIEFFRFQNCSTPDTSTTFVAYDDIYILEVDATDPADFLGSKTRVLSFPPNADGTTSDWTTSTGTDHYALIDENGVDDSDYIQTATDTDEDLFDITDTTAEGLYVALKVEAEAIAITTTSHTLDVKCDSGGSQGETNHAVTSTTDSVVLPHYQAADPAGGAWTQTDIDNVEVGVEFNT